MQVFGLFALALSVVVGYLAFSRVSTLETALEAVFTSGPMNLLVNQTSFFFFMIPVVALIILATVAAIWAVQSWMS